MKRQKERVLVALSGGVDSAVTAYLLKKEGYDVSGGFIKNWSEQKDPRMGTCAWRTERRDALRVAAFLDIELLTFDFEEQYRKLVVEELYRGYEAGLTPNPDVLCNEYVKFGLFWEAAKRLGFDLMATGHYAVVKKDKTGKGHLYRGLDHDKDQSYFLYRVSQEALAHSLMPLGGLKKTIVRKIAEKVGLPVADKADSQGICFIGKIDLPTFLSTRIKSKPGQIVTVDGVQIGRHSGLANYTIGQRQRIEVADKHAWYVAEKDSKNNRLIVVNKADHPKLMIKEMVIDDLHLFDTSAKDEMTVKVQTRYRQEPGWAVIHINKDKTAKIDFKKPIQAAAIGQSAVIYKGVECLGGGVIRKTRSL